LQHKAAAKETAREIGTQQHLPIDINTVYRLQAFLAVKTKDMSRKTRKTSP
jgi:hypothetical protein